MKLCIRKGVAMSERREVPPKVMTFRPGAVSRWFFRRDAVLMPIYSSSVSEDWRMRMTGTETVSESNREVCTGEVK